MIPVHKNMILSILVLQDWKIHFNTASLYNHLKSYIQNLLSTIKFLQDNDIDRIWKAVKS